MVKNQEGIYFVYRSTRQVYKVRITDIMYFARSGRRVTMYSRELGAVELYCSLSESCFFQMDFIILISLLLSIYSI